MAQPPAPPVLPTNMTLQQAEMMGPDGNNPYYPEGGDLSGGLPINLDSLRDGPPGSKPFYPYSTLIRYAIKGSPTGKLLLEDIYYAIESRFPYFRTAPAGWKNSVRHNLSLNPCFVKVPRPLTDRGKGSYWTVDDNVDPRTGVHRVRKKKTKKEKTEVIERDTDYHDGAEYAAEPAPTFEDPHAQFVQQQIEDAGPSRAPPVYAPAYPPTYDPSYQMLGMRYPPMPIISPDEHLPTDEHGNVDWRLTWHKELSDLQQHTAEQEKANANQEWYRVMFFRLRSGLMAPYDPGMMPVPGAAAPHGMPHAEHEVPQDATVHE